MKSRNYRHAISMLYRTVWAIHPAKFAELEAVLLRHVRGEPIPPEVLGRFNPGENVQVEQISVTLPAPGSRSPQSFDDGPSAPLVKETDDGYTIVGSVGVIPCSGVISARPSLFDEWSGGTSHENMGRATEKALADSKVESIVYDIDSPGGIVFGMVEAAEKVFAAKKTKPTTAVANYVAASAAYWYASQAAEIVISPTGQVGSIGVLIGNTDQTKMLEMMGVSSVLVTNDSSPYKAEGWPETPFTPEAREELRSEVNYYAEKFIAAISKGRGIRANTVSKDFGQGRMLRAEDALAARMVDRIDTLEAVLQTLNKTKSRASRRNVAAQMVKLRLPTA